MSAPPSRRFASACLLTCLTLLAFAVALSARADVAKVAHQPGKLLQSLLAGPLAGVDEIVFAQRVSGRDHWYVNFGY
ncbi:MAG: hypothetical protein IIA67_02910 [Planctomycetes bacterium]|nr:hypothetical protein [Planctomycetota bacterium]